MSSEHDTSNIHSSGVYRIDASYINKIRKLYTLGEYDRAIRCLFGDVRVSIEDLTYSQANSLILYGRKIKHINAKKDSQNIQYSTKEHPLFTSFKLEQQHDEANNTMPNGIDGILYKAEDSDPSSGEGWPIAILSNGGLVKKNKRPIVGKRQTTPTQEHRNPEEGEYRSIWGLKPQKKVKDLICDTEGCDSDITEDQDSELLRAKQQLTDYVTMFPTINNKLKSEGCPQEGYPLPLECEVERTEDMEREECSVNKVKSTDMLEGFYSKDVYDEWLDKKKYNTNY